MPFVETQQKRICFIHIPKTGGTSVEEWMRSVGQLHFHSAGVSAGLKVTPQHLTLTDLNNMFCPEYFDYKFAVVRNPFKRIESEYKMRYLLSTDGHLKTFAPFPVWLEGVLNQAKNNSGFLDNHFRPQWTFLGNDVTVFRFEDGLNKILDSVAKEIGISPPKAVPHQLSSKPFDGALEWGPTEVDRVTEFYGRDFARFSYPTEI